MRVFRILIFVLTIGLLSLVDAGRVVADSAFNECRNKPTQSCLMAHAVEIAAQLSDAQVRDNAFAELARSQATLGLSQVARKTIERITSDKKRAETLHSIEVRRKDEQRKDQLARDQKLLSTVSERAKTGLTDEALKITENIRDDRIRASAYGAVARAYAQAGSLADAFALVGRINPNLQYLALDPISQSRAHPDTIAENIKFANGLSSGRWRDTAFSHIAVTQAAAGQKTGANQSIDQVESEGRRELLLQQTIRIQAERGELMEARQRLDRADSLHTRIGAYLKIAAVQEKIGDKESAVKTLIEGRQDLETALAQLPPLDQLGEGALWLIDGFVSASIQQLVRLGQIEEAFKTANIISDDEFSAFSIQQIALEQVTLGQHEDALRTVEKIADPRRREESKNSVLGAISRENVKSGKVEEATELARTIAPGRKQDDALLMVASDQIRAGNIAGALETVRQMSDPDSGLRQIVGWRSRAGQFAEALLFADAMVGSRNRLRELTIIAIDQTKAGQVGEALKTAERVKTPDRYRVYSAIAFALPN